MAMKDLVGHWRAGMALVLGLTGCASVSLTNIQEGPAAQASPPAVIYVADFDSTGCDWKVDRTGAELQAFERTLDQYLAAEIVGRLNKYVTEAKILEPNRPLPADGWVVRGKLLRVEQGSRALRATVGFGAGGTKLETLTEVVDTRARPPITVMRFNSTGGTNAEPGAILSADPVSIGVTLAVQSLGGLTTDADRTARMITAQISQYFYNEGWPLRGRVLSPKTNPISPPPPRRESPAPLAPSTGGTKGK
jgi:Domain of unknown function (DUF4410)